MNTQKPALKIVFALLMLGTVSAARSDEAAEAWEKMVFHIDESRNARWALMLANSYLDDSPGAKIVIVAFGPDASVPVVQGHTTTASGGLEPLATGAVHCCRPNTSS